MASMFHEGSRWLQDRFDTRRYADRLEDRIVADTIDEVGMLLIDFERGRRIRINGSASIALDDPLTAAFPGAQFVVRVAPSEVFPNCPRCIHRRALVDRSDYVPREGCDTPVPDWKRSEPGRDVLPRR